MAKCPKCQGELEFINNNQARCKNCDKLYVIKAPEAPNKAPNNPPAVEHTEYEKKQLKYFVLYKKLPMIIFIVILAISFIAGIIGASVITGGMGALYWFISVLIGTISAYIYYFLLKINFSHKLLQIHYLQKLAGEEETVLNCTNTKKK